MRVSDSSRTNVASVVNPRPRYNCVQRTRSGVSAGDELMRDNSLLYQRAVVAVEHGSDIKVEQAWTPIRAAAVRERLPPGLVKVRGTRTRSWYHPARRQRTAWPPRHAAVSTANVCCHGGPIASRSEEHTSELQ